MMVPVVPAVLPTCGVPCILTAPLQPYQVTQYSVPVVTVTVTAQTFCSEMIICNPVGGNNGNNSSGSMSNGSTMSTGNSGGNGSSSSTRASSTSSSAAGTTSKVIVTVTPSSINTSTVKSNEAAIKVSQGPFWLTVVIAFMAIFVVG